MASETSVVLGSSEDSLVGRSLAETHHGVSARAGMTSGRVVCSDHGL